ALLAYANYLGELIWPVHLAAYYPHPGAAVSIVRALAAGCSLVLITVLAIGLRRRWPYLAVGWLWYLITLTPVIGLVQIGDHGMADRYTYIPMIGLFLLLTWSVADMAATWRLPRFLLSAATAAILVACAAFTWKQLAYWRDDRALWEHALAVTANNAMAHNNLGMDYYRKDMLVQAQNEIEQAVTIDPRVFLFHNNRAKMLRDLGRTEEAVAEFRKAIELASNDVVVHFNLANLLRDLGREDEALAEYSKAIALDPQHPLPRDNFANLLRDLGRPGEAAAEFQRAIELDPEYASPHIGLGNALADLGRREEAIEQYREAISLTPDNALAHNNLGLAYQASGLYDEAMAEYRKAEKLGFPQATSRLQACARQQALRPRLPDLLSGKYKPADNAERLVFADLCAQPFEGRYAQAARLYADAFAADAAQTDIGLATDRVHAASAAARAGCGQGQDVATLDESEKARLRGQALKWLLAVLEITTDRARNGTPSTRIAALQALRMWRRETGLACVRDPAALAKLPDAERQTWQKLWQDVEAVLTATNAPRPIVSKP
ncbi:MAG TPA: tetratricopeptide repeat protein, partial [Gemmataceae bacterium]